MTGGGFETSYGVTDMFEELEIDDDAEDFPGDFYVTPSPSSAIDWQSLIAQLDSNSEDLADNISILLNLLAKPASTDATVTEKVAAVARGISNAYANLNQTAWTAAVADLCLEWKVYAAQLGDVDSRFDLAQRDARLRGLGNGERPGGESEWIPLAWESVLNAFDIGKLPTAPFQRNQEAVRLLDMAGRLIRWRHHESREAATAWLSALLKRLGESSLIDSLSDQLTPLRDEILRTMEGTLRVLDSVMPSADRAVKPLLDQYRVLCDIPTPLARVPDLMPISEALNSEFPWFADVTTWIFRQLAVRSGGTLGFKIPPLLLLGPPGVGKTSYLQRLAELSGLPFLSLSLAGKSDNRDLAGTARGWGTGHPSRVIALINETRTANPIVLLDEIDKAGGSDHNGRITDTLLTLLEPASSTKFYDDFLWGHADLSRVSWMATANSTATLPITLLGRMEVKRVPHPKPEHYPAIVKRALDGYLRREGLDPAWMGNITLTEWDWLGQYFTSPRLARRAVEMLVNHRLTDAAGIRM